jgi:ATP-binding cassette subfamily E protein 1
MLMNSQPINLLKLSGNLIPMDRIAIVDKKKCNPGMCGNYLCIRSCPVNRRGEDCITVDDDSKKAMIDEKLCIGCGICTKKCPFDAINIVNLPSELKDEPVHRYGQNGFHLFNLPIPIFGKVVGIIGKNGIGKTTALNILAGLLEPNFGRKNFKASNKDLIQRFKGSELHHFFEKLEAKEIIISIKPQQVSLLPKAFKGTVKELLEERDEKNKLDEISKELEIDGILDRKLEQVSGGELQRIAIAATVLKKANVYFFDEPTSYLDIKQRIKVSKFIKNLADKDTAVLLVEHDLIILDYLADYLHIVYGKQGAFGVISSFQSTREGINEYLSGFLKKENMRFRQSKINFEERPAANLRKEQFIAIQWDNIQKKLGNFEMNANPGILYKHHMTGVLGENGIGKTTFAKILANVIKPDKGEIQGNIKLAYKPQYIDTNSDIKVVDFLKEAISKFRTQIIVPFGLSNLFNKKLNELSGGELQSVMIAKCISEDVDLFLLDEPSAYLDVEQRLTVSKAIRKLIEDKGKTALIVDHDLLFIDYLSDDLMIFEGIASLKGTVKGVFSMEEGMNHFLSSLNISLRREYETKRPRINKLDSRLDRKQKSENKLYYPY